VKDLGKTISRIKRQIDILAHYQTFDYALLLPETGRQASGNFVDRLADVLKVTNLQDVNDERIDFSIGCASLPEDGSNLDTVIALAWSRLYQK
jgi:GGDEF domain-containing protein